jgi:hypothetical protein
VPARDATIIRAWLVPACNRAKMKALPTFTMGNHKGCPYLRSGVIIVTTYGGVSSSGEGRL